ncbi:AzlD domain-containing protein [Lacticaseibacillus hulanensis]|uniref:AzlD domain-containing protein n=1 Tax=Lacticaseibacillus hulanensis TaxID=2493111 RepID=UPI000FDAEFB0|nr:AzlD domain-containing protein [Lacticaseibacillus hulanensis]
MLLVIITTGLVTWLCRVLPFVVLKKWGMPRWMVDFLSFVPVAIMSALLFDNLLVQHLGSLPTLNVPNTLAAIPCFIAAILTRSLLVIAVVGVISLALIRYIM